MPEFEALAHPIRIGLLADTHRRNPKRGLPQGLLDALAGSELIIHAGDISERWVLEILEQIAPVRAVVGNNDSFELLRELPEERFFVSGRHRIGLLHGYSDMATRAVTAKAWTLDRMRGVVDCAVYGHSHQPEIAQRDGLLMVNPGSPTDFRWAKGPTCGILDVGEVLRARLIDLSATAGAR
ncbi:MAG: metallophosphoesterase family protein [Thermomicrobiales bacterium]